MCRLVRATCTVHSISAQTSHEGIRWMYQSYKELRAYCLDIYCGEIPASVIIVNIAMGSKRLWSYFQNFRSQQFHELFLIFEVNHCDIAHLSQVTKSHQKICEIDCCNLTNLTETEIIKVQIILNKLKWIHNPFLVGFKYLDRVWNQESNKYDFIKGLGCFVHKYMIPLSLWGTF